MSQLKKAGAVIGILGACGVISGLASKKMTHLKESGKSSDVLDVINAAAGIPNTVAEVVAEVSSVPLGLSVALLPISIPLYIMCPKMRQVISAATSVYLLSSCSSVIYKNTKQSISK